MYTMSAYLKVSLIIMVEESAAVLEYWSLESVRLGGRIVRGAVPCESLTVWRGVGLER